MDMTKLGVFIVFCMAYKFEYSVLFGIRLDKRAQVVGCSTHKVNNILIYVNKI